MKIRSAKRGVAICCSIAVSAYAIVIGLSLLVSSLAKYNPLLSLSLRALLLVALGAPLVLLIAITGMLSALSLDKSSRRKWLLAGVNFLGIAGTGILTYMLLSFGGLYPSDEEAAQAHMVFEYIQENYEFHTTSIVEPGRIPVWTPAGIDGAPHTVMVYYVTERSEQDKFIDLLKQYRSTVHRHPLIIEFYKEENWIVDERAPDGHQIRGHREREKRIRKVRLR